MSKMNTEQTRLLMENFKKYLEEDYPPGVSSRDIDRQFGNDIRSLPVGVEFVFLIKINKELFQKNGNIEITNIYPTMDPHMKEFNEDFRPKVSSTLYKNFLDMTLAEINDFKENNIKIPDLIALTGYAEDVEIGDDYNFYLGTEIKIGGIETGAEKWTTFSEDETNNLSSIIENSPGYEKWVRRKYQEYGDNFDPHNN